MGWTRAVQGIADVTAKYVNEAITERTLDRILVEANHVLRREHPTSIHRIGYLVPPYRTAFEEARLTGFVTLVAIDEQGNVYDLTKLADDDPT